MENNYSRTKMLQEALDHSSLTMEDLEEKLNMPFLEIYSKLESPDHEISTPIIRTVSDALGIPDAYFFDGLRYNEHGQLVPNSPSNYVDGWKDEI
ncbi:helix-turn-helix transcriptional regulator [Adhaeribacter swui]|uniref:Helix-turn-helix transcriptional regulator n=1 Tax=Adhaeribacter swui TaxID=2086471 RepID=A0A7G7GAZ0_9BACT|nr:helix-turn-helix transcriptional regulator [Adhaeribacter swui]QNF34324.1 helix-turn-helix transcriptional regulator [Adhaeribacter swui]